MTFRILLLGTRNVRFAKERPSPWLYPGVALSLFYAISLGVPSTVFAQRNLVFDAPEECPRENEFRDVLERHLEANSQLDEAFTLTVRITRENDESNAFVLELNLQSQMEEGRRRLVSRDCAALVDAAVVVVALALEPNFEEHTEELTEEHTEQEEPPVETSPPRSPDRSRAIRLSGWIVARLSVGALPAPAAGVSTGLALDYSRLRVELGFLWYPSSQGYISGSDEAGGDFSVFSAEARICVDTFYRALTLMFCGGLEAGQTRAVGFGVSQPGEGSALWIAPEVSALFIWRPVSVFALRLDAALLVPTRRTVFFIEGVGDVYQVAPVAGRFGLGFEIHFL